MSASWKDDAVKGWDLLSWEGEAQWFATKNECWGTSQDTEPRKRIMGGRLRSLDALIGTIRNAEALHWNLYLNANPSRAMSKKKLAREDITRWRCIVIDLDPGADALIPPKPRISWDFAKECVSVPDTYLLKAHRIFSGRGYQYWLPTAEKNEGGEQYKIEAERIMSGYLRALKDCSEEWAPGWIVDTTCSDLARVVRCPGSVNQKTGNRATVEYVSTYAGIDIGSLMCYNTQPAPEPPRMMASDLSSLMAVLPALNIRARSFILEGTTSPGRHTACFATCKNLHELGVPRASALDWLYVGAVRCYQPLPVEEVRRIVSQVYGKA